MANTGSLRDVANALAERYLRPYISRLKQTGLVPLHPKQVHDSIWGTISLSSLEVALIDSPLLQRMRHLKQLGVAHWLYPGADHSRFEHSLGVLHQAQQLIQAINRSGETAYGPGDVITAADQVVVRTAALLHDIGHPVLSHVSEYALRLDPLRLLEIQRERKALVDEQVTVSELIAAQVVRSEAFRELLEVIQSGQQRELGSSTLPAPLADFPDRVARCILGQSISSVVPLLHELVSGPYDADKLDYMVRDAVAAGIPTIIDISRLVQKLTVRRFRPIDLPDRVNKHVKADTPQSYIFGFPWSGLSVVDELLLARLIIYSKLYRHPKVAALEAMVQLMIRQLTAAVGVQAVVSFVYKIVDDQLILADREMLNRWVGFDPSGADTAQRKAMESASLLLERLRDRDLFVRAFAFFPGDAPRADVKEEPEDTPFARLVKHVTAERTGDSFVEEVSKEVGEIVRAAAPVRANETISPTDQQMIVVRSINPPSQKELRHAWIFPSGGAPRTFSQTGIYKDAWSGSFNSASPKAYLFCPRQLAPYAFIAAETVIARRFNLPIPEWMVEEAKQIPSQLRAIRLKLRDSGYYGGKPAYLKPRHERLLRADMEKTVADFATRFAVVQQVEEASGAIVGHLSMEQRTWTWLNQFDCDDHIERASSLLSRSRVIGRKEAVEALRSFIKRHPEFKDASVLALSQGADSAQIVQYYAADVPGLKTFPSLVALAESDRDAPIIFFDDFCGSGSQTVNALGSMFGVEELKKPDLGEQRPLALEPEREYLRSRNFAFLFVAGWKDGIKAVQNAIDDLSLRGIAQAYLTDEDIPFATVELEDEEFAERCRKVGEDLLTSQQPEWPEKKIKSRALGYGNRGMLLFFPYNSPTQTLTLMWSEGETNESAWVSLMSRRKKVT